MLKRILALPGQTVCRTGLKIAVDDAEDRRGNATPAVDPYRSGRDAVCSTGEVFVMNWQSEDSLDRRCFWTAPRIRGYRQGGAGVDA